MAKKIDADRQEERFFSLPVTGRLGVWTGRQRLGKMATGVSTRSYDRQRRPGVTPYKYSVTIPVNVPWHSLRRYNKTNLKIFFIFTFLPHCTYIIQLLRTNYNTDINL